MPKKAIVTETNGRRFMVAPNGDLTWKQIDGGGTIMTAAEVDKARAASDKFANQSEQVIKFNATGRHEVEVYASRNGEVNVGCQTILRKDVVRLSDLSLAMRGRAKKKGRK